MCKILRAFCYWFVILGIALLSTLIPSCSPRINQADRLHHESLVWDAHSDSVQSIMLQGLDLSRRNSFSFQDIPRMEEGGLDVQVFALWPDAIYAPRRCARRTLQMIDAMLESIEGSSGRMKLARTASDVEQITQAGKLAALLSIEGGHAIEDDLNLLRAFHRLGVSSMTLTHYNTHGWADSSSDESRWGGLNSFGEEVVREMNRLGMVIDVSHVSDETFYDVLRVSQDPVIASHSNCRTLCDHVRNMSDEMIKELAGNGGVICITFVPDFTTQKFKEARAKAQREAQKNAPAEESVPEDLDEWAKQRELAPRIMPKIPYPTIEDTLDQIDYAVKIAGVDHVGIGHDYSVIHPTPPGLEDVSKFLNLTKGLLERGYSERDIRKILGENLLRIWQDVTDK